MKLVVSLLLIAASILAQQTQPNQAPSPPETKPEDLCILEGQATNVSTGAPLRKTEITLRGIARATGAMPSTYTATSDAGGNFSIKEIEPKPPTK
jgi:hypothetical protein